VLTKGQEQIRLILNRYDSRDTVSVEDVERSLGMRVFWKVSNDYEAVTTSVTTGKPIVLNGGSPYTRDLAGLAAQVTGKPLDKSLQRSRLARILTAPLKGVMRQRSKRQEGGK
jgi:pilus assembly protein CpaE